MTSLPVLKLSLDQDYFSSMCRMRTEWKRSANRSSNGGQNGTANQLPKERVMMVFNFIRDLIVMCHSSPPQRHHGGFVCLLISFIGFLLAEVRAIASMIEKQAQIVVKQKVSAESKTGKEAVLAQYANVTDEEEYPYCCYY